MLTREEELAEVLSLVERLTLDEVRTNAVLCLGLRSTIRGHAKLGGKVKAGSGY